MDRKSSGEKKGKVKSSDDDESLDSELAQSSLALRARNSLELSRERLTRSRMEVSGESLTSDTAQRPTSGAGRRVSISTTGTAPHHSPSGKIHMPLTRNFTTVIGEDQASKMAAEHPQGGSGLMKSLQKASEDNMQSMSADRVTDPDHPPEVVPVMGQRPILDVDPEIVGEALAVISVKDHDEIDSEHVVKRNSYRNLHRPDVSGLPWVQASVGSAEDAVAEKVRSFHASQKSLLDQSGSGSGSKRVVEPIHEEEAPQQEYVIEETTMTETLGPTERPPTEDHQEEDHEEDHEEEILDEEFKKHFEHSDNEDEEEEEVEVVENDELASENVTPENPTGTGKPQPGVDYNQSAVPGSLSTIRTEFSRQYEFPELVVMKHAAEVEGRSGATSPAHTGIPVHSAWSYEALQAAAAVADTVLVAAIRNMSHLDDDTARKNSPSDLIRAAEILTDDVMKFAIRRVINADEVERARLREHAVWPPRAVEAATILTDEILATALQKWNDEQAWRDEVAKRSWSQKAISVANLVTKHILEAALHRVRSASAVSDGGQRIRTPSASRREPLWSEDALRAAILLTNDILSSAVLNVAPEDGSGVFMSTRLPSEHPWTMEAIQAASRIVHSVLLDALEQSIDNTVNIPIGAARNSTEAILAAALKQLQDEGVVDHTAAAGTQKHQPEYFEVQKSSAGSRQKDSSVHPTYTPLDDLPAPQDGHMTPAPAARIASASSTASSRKSSASGKAPGASERVPSGRVSSASSAGKPARVPSGSVRVPSAGKVASGSNIQKIPSGSATGKVPSGTSASAVQAASGGKLPTKDDSFLGMLELGYQPSVHSVTTTLTSETVQREIFHQDDSNASKAGTLGSAQKARAGPDSAATVDSLLSGPPAGPAAAAGTHSPKGAKNAEKSPEADLEVTHPEQALRSDASLASIGAEGSLSGAPENVVPVRPMTEWIGIKKTPAVPVVSAPVPNSASAAKRDSASNASVGSAGIVPAALQATTDAGRIDPVSAAQKSQELVGGRKKATPANQDSTDSGNNSANNSNRSRPARPLKKKSANVRQFFFGGHQLP